MYIAFYPFKKLLWLSIANTENCIPLTGQQRNTCSPPQQPSTLSPSNYNPSSLRAATILMFLTISFSFLSPKHASLNTLALPGLFFLFFFFLRGGRIFLLGVFLAKEPPLSSFPTFFYFKFYFLKYQISCPVISCNLNFVDCILWNNLFFSVAHIFCKLMHHLEVKK